MQRTSRSPRREGTLAQRFLPSPLTVAWAVVPFLAPVFKALGVVDRGLRVTQPARARAAAFVRSALGPAMRMLGRGAARVLPNPMSVAFVIIFGVERVAQAVNWTKRALARQ